MRDFGNRPAITDLAPLVHALMPIVVGGQDLARGDQCRDLILGELSDFLTPAGECDYHGGGGSLESGWWMINSKVGVRGSGGRRSGKSRESGIVLACRMAGAAQGFLVTDPAHRVTRCPVVGGCVLNSPASAADVLPVTDGTIYSTNTAITNQYIATSSSLRGALEFAALDTSKFASFQLALNPYALPLGDLTVAIYGYGNADGAITGDDYNAGTLLGTLTLPVNLGYGQDAFFDATDFVRNVPGEFFGFNLRTDSGGDTFSSLEYNYGKPSRLVVTVVPEPSTCALLVMTGT